MRKIIITIARQCGAGGKEIGRIISQKLGIPYYDRELISKVADTSGMDEDSISKHDEKRPSGFFIPLAASYNMDIALSTSDKIFILQSEAIKKIAEEGSAVIVGRCADYILSENPNTVKIFVDLPYEKRLARICKELDISKDKASLHIARIDKQRGNYYTYYTGKKWGKFRNYDLIINSEIGMEETANIIIDYCKKKLENK